MYVGHFLCRTQARFKALLHEYQDLDPSSSGDKPLQSAIPGQEHMCGPTFMGIYSELCHGLEGIGLKIRPGLGRRFPLLQDCT
jgi:hypothetical protein